MRFPRENHREKLVSAIATSRSLFGVDTGLSVSDNVGEQSSLEKGGIF